MAIGGSAQVALSSRNTLIRKRLHKQLAARRMLLEALEGRQLMAVGPQLLGIQPNEGSVLVDGQVRHISPNELVFRFDDRVGLDGATLDGIRIIRSGSDGEFERASMATDLGSGGASLVEFYATEPGQVGNGIQISFTQVNRSDSRAPVVRVSGRNVSVEMNSNPLLETRVDDLIRAFDPTIAANSVTNLVYALRLRGSTTLAVGRTVNTAAPVVLSGANAAKITTDFGLGANLQVRLNAKDSGVAGVSIQVAVTTRDRGGPGAPTVTVNGKIISVELNSNSRNTSTVSDFIAAINGNAASSALVEATLVSGLGLTRLGSVGTAYSPLVLSGVTDVEIIPAYVGLGDTSREVIVRFAEALPDDRYRIEILGRGSRALLNVNGDAYNDGVDKAVSFELDLGAQIESIVPQPVERSATGQLTQATNRIDVYFNNDDLINSATIRSVNGLTIDQLRVQRPVLFFQSSDIIIAQNGALTAPDVLTPQFYQLFHLAGTLSNVDDTRILPTAVRYYPDADRVMLTFARPLSDLVDASNNPLTRGELRLRIGTNDAKPLPPVTYTPVNDAADTFAGADNLTGLWTPGTASSQSLVINSEIRNTTPFVLDFPGGSDEIGQRYNRMEAHFRRNFGTGALVSADSTDGVTTVLYNFQTQLGRFSGTTLLNSITDQQKQRAREIFSLYEQYLGVRFVETENLGLTIAVGDTRAVSPFPETSLTTSPGVITLNSVGNEFLESGILATGQLATILDSQDFGNSTDNNFGGSFSRAVAQGIGNLLGLGGTDDLEGFTTQAFNNILAPGVGTEIVLPGDAEIVHGQYLFRPDSKDVDLYQFRLPVAGRISIEAFAERMSQASLLDTQIRLYQQLASGRWSEVAANNDYYSSDSFVELELGAGNYIVGVSASGNDQYDPTISDSGLGGRSQGNYQLRMDFHAPAADVLNDATGTALDGDADGTPGGVFDYWFRPGNASNTKFVDKAAAVSGLGTLASPYKTIQAALSAAVPGDVVRIVGNGGADGKLNTTADNLAYEIGFNANGQFLPDGATLDVPKDVSVLVDAGAILKLRRARVGVGSTSNSVDRSAGSLMVLGTPVLVDATGAVLKDLAGVPSVGSVFFTSISDATLGKNTSPAVNGTTPLAGDWGGIDFRNRIDSQDESRKNFERIGQFVNWISHADLRYGGGQVVVDGVSQAITPIQMIDSRPAIVYSQVTRSADAAMSATPNSFKESNFHTPDEQRGGAFAADYTRVGPEIHGNQITGNSLNGLLVKVRTSSDTLETMTVAGRFDDIDIVHIVPENLVIAGTAGGFISDTNAPPTTIVTLTSTTGGTLAAGTYRYRLTYVDASGNESPASNPTQSIVVAANASVILSNLPPVRTGSSFVARRLYRSDATGTGNYVLVRELNASSSTVTDTGTTLGSPLNEATVTLRSRLDGRLAIDGGTVVKLQGARIEVQFGAQLIAEGSSDRPVVFTSTSDVRYGAGGTFATSASSTAAAAGNWGGIYLAPTSSASIDHAVVAYGGGTTRIEGGFADFNAIETQQGALRLTNSRLEKNAAGNLTSTDADRSGRGTNTNATIFVRGAQPIIADNIIVESNGAAISVNVSALNSTLISDRGRSTGALSLASNKLNNQGPLVQGNRMNKNAINGMVVRGGILTTEGVWDDTDIVHVVQDEIRVPNFSTYGGLSLESSSSQSLVVKLGGSAAGLTASGRLLDNADRIGGSVRLIGQPGFPVVMTSLSDDTVGVGFTPDGVAMTNTDELIPQNPSSVGGDWRSVLIDQNSNDRNVASLSEAELAQAVSPGTNATPTSSQYLGELAPNLNSGDETRRLGFQVQGVISDPSDIDVYSFRGTAGTEVWFDIDRTLNSLDTVVELVDASGRILALSDNSLAEEANPSLLYQSSDMPGQSVHSLRKSTPELYLKNATGTPKDLYSTNPRDAGMRVVLPGEPGTAAQYHVRVRSSNLRAGDAASRLLDPNFLSAGLTRGSYQMQVRLRELDEVPGSSVTYADLRFATNGIEIQGMPRHSPLLGETAETTANNNTIGQAQQLGNLLVTDKQAISIAGSLDAFTDVDWYNFSIDYTAIRPTGLREYFATVFDMDYAAGIGRPDTSIYVFDSTGRLILSGLTSNLVDDQEGGLNSSGTSDLSRGSSGSLDPFVGSVELPVGQYFLAVTNSQNVPRAMEAYTSATPTGALAAIRLQPTNGVQLIAEDHVNSTGGSTAVAPQTPVLFPAGNSAVPFNLSDVGLYVSQNVALNATNIYMVNPMTGEVSNTVGRFGNAVNDIAFRYNGSLRAFDFSPQFPNGTTDQDGLMDYLDINPGTAAATDIGDLNLQTSHIDGTNAADSNDGIYTNAITFASIGGQERGFIVGSRGPQFARANVGTSRPGVDYLENIIYEFDEVSGSATSAPAGDKTGIAIGFNAGTAVRERGYIETGTLGAPVRGLIARETTRVSSNGVTTRIIRDGDSFTLLDSSNFTATFEFDSGPEVLVNYNPAAGLSIADGLQFALDGVVYEFNTIQGTPGVTAGAVAINISQTSTYKQVVDAIAASVGNGITVTSEGNRLLFGGALIGDFTQMQNAGIFIDVGSSGNVSPGAIKVPFLATDTADDLATRMVLAINASGIPGLSASATNARVTLTGATVVNAGPLQIAGAPGGTVTGVAVINGVMYAVSDEGGLYVVNSPTSLSVGNVGQYVASSYELLGVRFSGLSAGPTRLQNGTFAQTLFGVDENGVLYAFDTSGHLLPIFAGGATSVDTGVFGANGISFSTLDYNLWHVTNQRGADAGHGLPVTADASRGTAVRGGSSLYFGFESPAANGVNYSSVTDPVIRNSYDFPGGAAGAIESQTFDLSGMSAGDLPTLYFNYRFDTENASADLPLGQSPTDYMRDALRVYVSGEDGQWILAATNNSARGGNSLDDEFDPFVSLNTDVQELFDNNGQWRQARVPLDLFAGQANVKLRFEFASAGGFGFGMTGGKGPELRMLSGDRLIDGQTVTIGGKVFELEMGPSLSMPAGSSITAGDSVTIEGVTYIFTDGTLPVIAPNVAVNFSATQSAEQVASALLSAILSAPRVQATINLTAGEQNDTLATALVASTSGDSAVIRVTGNIGDNVGLSDPTADVDIVRVDLAQGSTVTADVLALVNGSPLDSYLRIFNSAGTQLAANDNRFGSTDSRLNFVAPSEGTYYFAVSGAGNSAYKSAVLGTGAGASSGNYQLVLNVLRQLSPVQSGARVQLQGVANLSLPASSPIVLQGANGTTGVPVYVNVGMSASQVGQALQQALARTYANGVTTAFPLYGDTLSLTGLVQYDSFDFFTGLPAPSLNELDPGPFGATTGFVGDQFSAFNASTDFAGNRSNANPGALRAQANAFEGVYLDDFIIGLAGRGEMVSNAPVDTTFISDPQLTATTPAKANIEVLVGPYQLEIRGGTEYGAPRLDGFPTTIDLVNAVSPQQRLGEGVALRFNGASAFVAGSTFVISDGTRSLTFELDNIDDSIATRPGNIPVTFSNAALDPLTGSLRSESAGVIAARVRDLINSSAVQSVLDIKAVLLNSDPTGQTNNTVVLIGQANVTVPTSIATTIISSGNGDSNREREQGQVIISSTKVTGSSRFGVSITSGGRDANGNPIGGTPRNLLTINTDRLVTGAVVMNSQFLANGAGGILVSGEPNTTNSVPAPVPYARLINNTIVGSRTLSTGIGIQVQSNASPTIMNNIVANSAVGLSVDASSTSTVVGGMVFHRNAANTSGSATVGQFPLIVPAATNIFADVANGNLYPAAGSPIIDSSIDSLQDRPSLVTVKNSVGIPASTILAPQYDVNGLLRVDDPSVASPSGLGENVFKDRGAQDRADFVGPSVVMLNPIDNDVNGLDKNPATSIIELTNFTAKYFDIQLYDGLEPSDPNRGSNIKDDTVTSASVLVYENGVPLVDGIDYRFGYDPTSNVIRLTPLAGVFSSSSVYQIRFVNKQETAITTVPGRNYSDGSVITITDTNNVVTTFEIDTGYLLTVPTIDGVTASVVDGGVLTLDDGVRKLTFELDNNGSLSSASNIAIAIPTSATPVQVAQRIQAAIVASAMQFTVVDLGSGRLQIDGSSISTFDVGTTGLTVTGQPGVAPAFGLQIPLVAGRPVTLLDGESFTINRTTMPVTFELDSNGIVTPGRIAVRFTAGASAATIGQALVTAIRNAGLGLTPTYAGNGLVLLGGDAATVLGLTNTQLKQAGVAGQAAAKAIKVSAASTVDAATVANQIAAAINAAGLTGITATAFGDRVVVSGAKSLSGSQTSIIGAITDMAGNALKGNQVDGSTTLTIFLGEGLDYGDAPDPKYATKRENNGPRHKVVTGFSLGADVRPDADAKLINADEGDDGVQFSQIVAGFQTSVTVSLTRPVGTSAFLSGWIDYNQDGVFSNAERVANALPLLANSTTLSFIVPGSSLTGTTYARFRLSSSAAAVATPTGEAPDGEVEDYAIIVSGSPYTNQTNSLDVNGDGRVTPIDALQVINYLNSSAPKILTLPHTAAAPFVDVDGNGQVTPIDALLVINYLNTLPPGGSGEGEGSLLDDGSSSSDVSTANWFDGIEKALAPAAPIVVAKAVGSDDDQTADAFFADLSDDDAAAGVQRFGGTSSQATHDTALAMMSSPASEIAEEIVSQQVNWMLRSRLASFFRR